MAGALILQLSLSPNFADIRTLGETSTCFGLTSEVSVVGAHMSLTMGYHGPSADLLYTGVCERVPLWDNSHPFEDTPSAGRRDPLYRGA